MDANQGKALGKALGALRDQLNDRIDVLEGQEPTYNVPVPSVTVEGSTIDVAPLSEVLAAFTEVLTEDRERGSEVYTALTQALLSVTGAVSRQEDRIDLMAAQFERSIAQLTAAMMAPKSLVFDEDGEPVGLVVEKRALN